MTATVEKLRRKLYNGTKSERASWAAIADRVEIIISCMTDLGVAETIKMDRDKAKRVVEYCRRRAAGGRELSKREREMTDFLHAHNQSFDWAIAGDPTGMIARLAEGTNSLKRKAA